MIEWLSVKTQVFYSFVSDLFYGIFIDIMPKKEPVYIRVDE